MKELILLRSKAMSHQDFIQRLKSGLNELAAYFNVESTKDYGELLSRGETGFVLTAIDDQEYNYYFLGVSEREYKLVNIVPREKDIKYSEYNRASEMLQSRLAAKKEIRKACRIKLFDMAEKLEDLISSRMAREYLENIIKDHRNGAGSGELRRIDVLVTLLSRYSRKKTNITLLKEHLEKYQKLDHAYVEGVCARIDIGLRVLDAYHGKTSP